MRTDCVARESQSLIPLVGLGANCIEKLVEVARGDADASPLPSRDRGLFDFQRRSDGKLGEADCFAQLPQVVSKHGPSIRGGDILYTDERGNQPDIHGPDMHPRMLDIGAKLRERREQLGLTAVELAADLGVSQPTISRWENGLAAKTSIETFERWCERLGLHLVISVSDGAPLQDDQLNVEQRALLQAALNFASKLTSSEARLLRMQMELLVAEREPTAR